MDTKTRKTDAYRAGMAGEVLAAAYLRLKGYEVLESNYRYAHREIDLILQKDNTLVFAEVKTRAPGSLVSAPYAVNRRKQMFLYSAASKYVREKQWKEEIRFDIIWVERNRSGCRVIAHIPDAFSPLGG
ncbi:MAG: YraN family protein [Bacteroidales bacterium]|nr:YraN family protein [Bacteroidales bacterium]MDE7072916.1 YraN family protein [Bacteroidales bacterium]